MAQSLGARSQEPPIYAGMGMKCGRVDPESDPGPLSCLSVGNYGLAVFSPTWIIVPRVQIVPQDGCPVEGKS